MSKININDLKVGDRIQTDGEFSFDCDGMKFIMTWDNDVANVSYISNDYIIIYDVSLYLFLNSGELSLYKYE